MGLLQQADWDVFKRSETWKAFGVAVIMFGTIAFAGLTFTERAQAASQGFKKLGLTNDVAIAGVLSTSAKETQIGAAGTESGADSYKKTFDRLEAGRGAIPDSLKAKGVKQLGPGVGVQYLNLTFGKKHQKEY